MLLHTFVCNLHGIHQYPRFEEALRRDIRALPGPTTVKSGGRTVGPLVPLKATDPDRLGAVLTRAEALAKGRDPAADAALVPFGEVDPVDWSVRRCVR